MRRPFAIWIALKSSLWFVPTLVVLGSMAVGQGLVEAGARLPGWSQRELPAIFGISPEGSRSVLSAIATSMITVAGVAFSITIVALSLASSQYSPRVLRQFMRNRPNQWVLGVFVGAFAYCLTVLPRVRGGEEEFVPAVAVVGGVFYALLGVGCLIFFIHHVATSIQASCIIADIAAETRVAAAELYPDPLREAEEEPLLPGGDGEWVGVPAAVSGYVQLVDEAELLRVAAEHDLLIRIERGPGEFVVAGTPLVSVCGAKNRSEELIEPVRGTFSLERTRTIEQDVMFGVRQIVDVALRALSPSLNDPTTASMCVDYLTTILHQLADRRMGTRYLRDPAGKLRIAARAPNFTTVVEVAFGEIRVNADSQVVVLRRILHSLELLANVARSSDRRRALAAEAKALRDALARNTCDPAAGGVCAEADRLVARL